MTKSITLRKTGLRAVYAALAVAAAVVLPQIFHFVGIMTGAGAAVGAAFLPMQIPVLIAGFAAGPVVGIAAGILSPIVSFGISGMPAAVMLPNMICELAGYGLAAGLLSGRAMPIFGKIIIAQVVGRIFKALAILLSVYAFGSDAVAVSLIWTSISAGLAGIALQWAVLLPLLYAAKRRA